MPAPRPRLPDRRTLLSAVAWAGGLVALVWVLVPAALDRVPPRDDAEGTAHRPVLARGQAFHGYWRVTYVRDCPGESYRWVTSRADRGFVVQLPTSAVVLRGGELGPLPARATIPVAPFEVPHDLPLGKAGYQVRNLFACNWLQRLVPALRIPVDYPSIEFEVLPAPPGRHSAAPARPPLLAADPAGAPP